jgi:hypothetical protein
MSSGYRFVLAALVALLAALFGAAGATRIGWEFAPPARAGDLGGTIFPGASVTGGGDAPLWTRSDDDEYVVYGTVEYTAGQDVMSLAAGVRDRLTAAGWRRPDDLPALGGGPVLPTEDDPLIVTRGDLIVTYAGGDSFTVARAAPDWLWRYALAGAVLGALLGGLVTVWACRRAPRGSTAAQVAGALTWPTVVVALVLLYGAMLGRPALQTGRDMFYLHLLYVAGGPPRWIGLVAVAALTVVVVLGRRGVVARVPQPAADRSTA